MTFENIDFVWDASDLTPEVEHAAPAIVRLSAERVEFRGCSFQDARSQPDRLAADWRPIAIDWSGVPRGPDRRGASPGGK